MTDTPRRVFGILCVMVVVWIVTYWLYEPSRWEPKVTFGEAPADLALAEPITAPPAKPPPPPIPARVTQPPETEPQPVVDRPAPRVEPPAFREYVIQRGDSLESIAQRELGDRRLWRAIAEANPYLTPDKLRVGQTVIRIPLDVRNIQGRPVEDAGPAPTPAKPHTEYTIAAGDTLSGIAKQVYGDANLWRVIYDANRDTLQNPDRLPRGATIRIPPRPQR